MEASPQAPGVFLIHKRGRARLFYVSALSFLTCANVSQTFHGVAIKKDKLKVKQRHTSRLHSLKELRVVWLGSTRRHTKEPTLAESV